MPKGFSVEGHAEAGDPGEDIVCAALSALSITMINAMDEQLKLPCVVLADEGYLSFQLTEALDEDQTHDFTILWDAMLLGFTQIAETYPQNVQIECERKTISEEEKPC